MNGIVGYILSITAAAVICALVIKISDSNHTSGKIIKVVCGVFMSVTLLSPLKDLNFNSYTEYFEFYQTAAFEQAADGQELANEATRELIKEKTEAYILLEGDKLDINIDVEVNLSESNPPVPCSVVIQGEASPYHKQLLITYIQNELGIIQENLQWM